VRNGAAGAIEEDARLTALFLWTLQSTNGEAAEDEGDESEDEEVAEADEDANEGTSRGKVKGFTLVFDVAASLSPSGSSCPSGKAESSRPRKVSCAFCRSPSARSSSSARTMRRQ
jgi:hypothetical protein